MAENRRVTKGMVLRYHNAAMLELVRRRDRAVESNEPAVVERIDSALRSWASAYSLVEGHGPGCVELAAEVEHG